jgi:hypothetical protein
VAAFTPLMIAMGHKIIRYTKRKGIKFWVG